MKHLLLILGLLFCTLVLQAQDLIVTHKGDSIACKIESAGKEFVVFSMIKNSQVKKSLIRVQEVKEIRYKYYTNSSAYPAGIYPEKSYTPWKLAFSSGYSYRTAGMNKNLPPVLKDYVEKIKQGFHFNTDMFYYFSEYIGAGMQYSYNHSKASGSDPSLGTFSDNINISYFGPSFTYRALSLNRQNNFYMNFTVGYLGYKNKSVVNSEDILIEGRTAGVKYDMGYDVTVGKNTSIGFQLSYLTGVITQFDISSAQSTRIVKLDKENYENLGRIDFSIGLRFNW